MLQRLGRVLSPDALTIGFARRFATYKRADLILADIEKLTSMVNDAEAPGAVYFRRQGASARRTRQENAAADRQADAAHASLPTSSSSSRTTTSTSDAISSRAWMSG